jgi:hypothetical protein
MSIAVRYTVRTNNLLGEKGKHAAMVRPAWTADLEDVIERMAFCGASVPDVLAVLEHFFRAIEDMVLEGINVNTPLVNVHLSIQGTFGDSTERFDPRRHRVVVKVTPGKRLRRAVRQRARVERMVTARPAPCIYRYFDFNSGTTDTVLTAGGLGQVLGFHLKFDPHDPRQGIFFVGEDRRAIPCSVAAENSPKRLIFQVPDLPAGSYSLEVRATADDSDDVRAGTLGKRLTVVAEAAGPAAGAAPAELAEQCPEGKGRLPSDQR